MGQNIQLSGALQVKSQFTNFQIHGTNFWWVTIFSCQVHSKSKANSQPTVEILIRKKYHNLPAKKYSAFLTRPRFWSLGALIVGRNKYIATQRFFALTPRSLTVPVKGTKLMILTRNSNLHPQWFWSNQVSSFRARVSRIEFRKVRTFFWGPWKI